MMVQTMVFEYEPGIPNEKKDKNQICDNVDGENEDDSHSNEDLDLNEEVEDENNDLNDDQGQLLEFEEGREETHIIPADDPSVDNSEEKYMRQIENNAEYDDVQSVDYSHGGDTIGEDNELKIYKNDGRHVFSDDIAYNDNDDDNVADVDGVEDKHTDAIEEDKRRVSRPVSTN